jgi:hypothetical protein
MELLNDTQSMIAIHRLLHRLKHALEDLKSDTVTDIQQIKIRTVNILVSGHTVDGPACERNHCQTTQQAFIRKRLACSIKGH